MKHLYKNTVQILLNVNTVYLSWN